MFKKDRKASPICSQRRYFPLIYLMVRQNCSIFLLNTMHFSCGVLSLFRECARRDPFLPFLIIQVQFSVHIFVLVSTEHGRLVGNPVEMDMFKKRQSAVSVPVTFLLLLPKRLSSS